MEAKNKPKGLFLIWAIIGLLAAGAAAQTPFDITVGLVQDAALGSTVSITVTKTAGSEPIHGFDLLMVYDSVVLTCLGATPGPAFDIPGAYEWEYFESRGDTIGGYSGYHRIVGLASINDGPHHPLEVYIPDGTVLFTLEFEISADAAFECNYVPLRFYWNDCGDNAIAPDSLGSVLAISDGVYDWTGSGYSEISSPVEPFPGVFGAPDSCLVDTSITRLINFYNGGVDIHCDEQIDNRGDVNCNGITNEIADHVMYTNYFLNGLSAFGDHIQCSSDASDVNADGTGLQVEDLIYLYRIINGDAMPYPDIFPHDQIAVTFVQDDDTKTISLDYPDPLAGIHLVFDGEVAPTSLIEVEGVISAYAYDGEFTRMLIWPSVFDPDKPAFVTGGTFITYTGSALLIEAGAADYDDHVFQTTIQNTGSGLTIPYEFEIGIIENAVPGGNISIPVVKTAGSEPVVGFEFIFAYDASALSLAEAAPGILFNTPGDYEWEYFTYRLGDDVECDDPTCPSGLVRVVALAETNNGDHHPLETKIPDGTVLFTLDGQVSSDPTMEDLFVPLRFVWIECGDNAVAFGATGDSLAISDRVYEYDGSEITDQGFGLPGYYGAPDSCIGSVNPAIRYVDYRNGGYHVGPIENMELVVSIGNVTAHPGDSNICVDVRMTNPQHSIAGFTLFIQLSSPELVQFGISPDDSIAIDVTGSLISGWELIVQQTLSGTWHDLKITALSNIQPPFSNDIPPQFDGLLCRLVLHAYETIPPMITDSTVHLVINDTPNQTLFSDPNGSAIGLDGEQYDPQTVSFRDGLVSLSVPLIGDANNDGQLNVGDVVFLIAYVFSFGPAPLPMEAGDVNCDGEVNVADPVYMIAHIFLGGPPPVVDCPF
jgi:hypothetical protein